MTLDKAWQEFNNEFEIKATRDTKSALLRGAFAYKACRIGWTAEDIATVIQRNRTITNHARRLHEERSDKRFNPAYYKDYNNAVEVAGKLLDK